MAELCPRCGMTPLSECDGRGYTFVDDFTTRPCPNIQAREIREHFMVCATDKASALISVKPMKESPLFKMGPPGESPLVDRTTDNLYITGCTESLALSHLKLVLGRKGIMFPFLMVSDQRILRVFVGDESFKAQGDSKKATYNNLEYLMLDPALVIVWVGVVRYKNKAGAGALLDGLAMRQNANKPTWIIHQIGAQWSWVHTYSEEVRVFLDKHFEEVNLGSTVADPAMFDGIFDEPHEVAPLQPRRPEPRRSPPPEEPVDTDFGDVGLPGEGPNEKKKKYRKGGY